MSHRQRRLPCVLFAGWLAAVVLTSACASAPAIDPLPRWQSDDLAATPVDLEVNTDPGALEIAAAVPEAGALAAGVPPSPTAANSPHDPASEVYANLNRKFELSLGAAAYARFNTSAQISSAVGAGAVLDFEDLLGLETRSPVVRLDARYNFNDRHRLNFAIYDIERSGTQMVDEDLEIGDTVIPAGPVDSFFNTQIYKLSYQYNFVHDYRTQIGASLGLHVMQVDTGISSMSFNIEESFSVTAPLPLLGLHGAYALSEKWRLRASAEVLQLKIGNYGGFITDGILAIDNDLTKHVGWGLGLNSFQIGAEFEDGDLTMELDYGYQGILLYLRGYW